MCSELLIYSEDNEMIAKLVILKGVFKHEKN